VSLRFEPGAPAKINSSSFSQFIGLALLVNPHLPAVDVEKLTDSIVHESIHSMLFMLEEVEAPFLLDRLSAKIMVTSPWSGNVINLHAYLHACLVWYGLYRFWRRVSSTGEYSAERRRALQDKARSGFVHRPSQLIAHYRELCSPPILSYLQEVEAIMATGDKS
jgi:HEXXH motif-containing protein